MPQILNHIPKTRRKQVIGVVVSDAMQKTIVVRVDRKALHPLYKKYIAISKKFKAHDEQNSAKKGDVVRILESRPISKDKKWRLLEIINQQKAQS